MRETIPAGHLIGTIVVTWGLVRAPKAKRVFSRKSTGVGQVLI